MDTHHAASTRPLSVSTTRFSMTIRRWKHHIGHIQGFRTSAGLVSAIKIQKVPSWGTFSQFSRWVSRFRVAIHWHDHRARSSQQQVLWRLLQAAKVHKFPAVRTISESFHGLFSGKIDRKLWFFMIFPCVYHEHLWTIVVSCKFSLKPIPWLVGHVGPPLPKDYLRIIEPMKVWLGSSPA